MTLFENFIDSPVIGFDVEILSTTVGVLVGTHERRPTHVRSVSCDCSVGFAIVNALDRRTNLEVTHFASVSISLVNQL